MDTPFLFLAYQVYSVLEYPRISSLYFCGLFNVSHGLSYCFLVDTLNYDFITFYLDFGIAQYFGGTGVSFSKEIFYSYFVYIGSRDFSYLTYTIYLTFLMLAMFVLNGYGFRFLWPNTQWLNDSTPLFMPLANSFAFLFTMVYLKTSKKSPILHKICIFMMIINLIVAAISYILPYSTSIRLASLLQAIGIIRWT